MNLKNVLFSTVCTFVFSTSLFADADSCGTGKFSCKVKAPHSSTCCNASETCSTDTTGGAACLIPQKDRKPSQVSTPKASTAKPVKNSKSKGK